MHNHTRPSLCGLSPYLLVDPYFGEPSFVALQTSESDPPSLTLERRRNAWQRDVFAAQSSEHPIAPAALPYLVALNDADDEWLEVALDEASYDHAQSLDTGFHKICTGTLIESDLGGKALMDRLQQMWTVHVSGSRRHLRLASPRVMELVFQSAAPEDTQAWLGPIERWHHLNRHGQWHMVRGQSDLHENMSDEAFYGRHRDQQVMAARPPSPLRCEGALKAALLNSETIAQTLDAWQRLDHAFSPALIQELLALLEPATWPPAYTQEQKIEWCLGHLEKNHGKKQS
jgi:Domain of unknown function (DUF4123)